MKTRSEPKYLDIKNCIALLPKDEFDIVVQQLDKYLDNINIGGSGHPDLINKLIKHNKNSVGEPFRLFLSQNLIDVCLSVLSKSGENKVGTFNCVTDVLYREPCKLQLEFNNENRTYWKVIIPLQFLLKGWGEVDKGYQCYQHTIAENIKPARITQTPFGISEKSPESHELKNLKEYTYFGITGRNWLKRLSEHLREIRRGSNKRFHQAWREFMGMHNVIYTSTLVDVNYTYEKVMKWEEWAVDKHGTVESPNILNMIPGGFKGLRELYKLGITKRVNITLKERDKAIEEYARRYPRKGIPAPWMAKYWGIDENYLNYINKREDTFSDEQVREIRVLAKKGMTPEEIVKQVDARNVNQVKRVLAGKTYKRVQ